MLFHSREVTVVLPARFVECPQRRIGPNNTSRVFKIVSYIVQVVILNSVIFSLLLYFKKVFFSSLLL